MFAAARGAMFARPTFASIEDRIEAHAASSGNGRNTAIGAVRHHRSPRVAPQLGSKPRQREPGRSKPRQREPGLRALAEDARVVQAIEPRSVPAWPTRAGSGATSPAVKDGILTM